MYVLIPNEFLNAVKGYANIMNGFLQQEVKHDKFLLELEANVYGRRPAGATRRGEFGRILTRLQDKRFEFARLPSETCMYVWRRTGSLVLHHADDIRLAASGPNAYQASAAFVVAKVGVVEGIGVLTIFLKRAEIRTENDCLTIPDGELVGDVLNRLGLGSTAKLSKVPGKLIKQAGEDSGSRQVGRSNCTATRRASSST